MGAEYFTHECKHSRVQEKNEIKKLSFELYLAAAK